MLIKLFGGFGMMGLCIALHALFLTAALRRAARVRTSAEPPLIRDLHTVMVLAIWTVLAHLFEITLWAALYTWGKALPDLPTACYFSAVTYTTVGYGDLVLPQEWRLLGGIEALTGILMCGWSTGVSFAAFNRMITRRAGVPLEPEAGGTG